MTWNPPTIVYVVRQTGREDGPFKIGCTTDPVRRLNELRVWSPVPLELLATAPGTMYDEKLIHRVLKDHRLHGEWFSAHKDVSDLVSYMRANRALPEWARRDVPAKSTYFPTPQRAVSSLQTGT